MKKLNLNYFNKLNQIFIHEFYDRIDANIINNIEQIIPEFYIKWLYSPLISNSYLTPANIFWALSANYDANLFPVIKNCKKENPLFLPCASLKTYCPMLHDIKIIIENFYDIYDLYEPFDMDDPNYRLVLSLISMHDYNYLDYLKIICYKLKILEPVPSINCDKLFLSEHAKQILEILQEDPDDVEIFRLLFVTASEILYDNLCKLFVHKHASEQEAKEFYKLVKEILRLASRNSDTIRSRLFSYFRITDDMLAKIKSIGTLDEFFSCVNIILNRFFICVFGHYLQMISPVYKKPNRIMENMSALVAAIHFERDVYDIFDDVTWVFNLTDLGKSYLGIDHETIHKKTSKKEINYLIDNFQSLKEKETEDRYPVPESMIKYKLNIKLKDNIKYWHTIELNSKIYLQELFSMIADLFDLSWEAKHSFIYKNYNLEQENKIMLSKLDLNLSDTIDLIIYNQVNPYISSRSKIIKNSIEIIITVRKVSSSIKNIFFKDNLVQSSKSFRYKPQR